VPLKYLFLTHRKRLTRWTWPPAREISELEVIGDVSDYHLAFPQYEHRMRFLGEGEAVDLGGREFRSWSRWFAICYQQLGLRYQD